jgi:hypothetical protein
MGVRSGRVEGGRRAGGGEVVRFTQTQWLALEEYVEAKCEEIVAKQLGRDSLHESVRLSNAEDDLRQQILGD